MLQINLITNYHNQFGSKYTAVPYRSGMDKELLKKRFFENGIEVIFIKASEVFLKNKSVRDKIFLYTSSEDRGGYYKSFLEDIVLAISSMGGIVIPDYKYLQGHNNKVFMELLRKEWGPAANDNLQSYIFGSFEDYSSANINFTFPVVIKRSEGALSRGVFLAHNKTELNEIVRKISRSLNIKEEIKDYIRPFIYKGYLRKSKHRHKFIIQNFISDLDCDYKILIFDKKYYVLHRKVRKNDFRASGSGLKAYPKELPSGLLDYCNAVFNYFDVPFISLDIAYDGSNFYVLETQFLYFGTYTIEKSEYYFSKIEGSWVLVPDKSRLEKEYADSITNYLKAKNIF